MLAHLALFGALATDADRLGKTLRPGCVGLNAAAHIRGEPAAPAYPEDARQLGIGGTAQIKVTLDASGTPVDVSVYRSSGWPGLDQLAIAAAAQTKYSPEIVDCRTVAASYLFRAEFPGSI